MSAAAAQEYDPSPAASSIDQEFILKLNVTHSVLTDMTLQEIRFDRRSPLSEIKQQIEPRLGTKACNMTFQLKDAYGAFVAEMGNDSETLQFYGAQDHYTLHVIDNDPDSVLKDIANVNQVEKYEISEEAYNNRTNTFRKFKEQMMSENPGFMAQHHIGPTHQQEEASQIHIGQRCRTLLGGNRKGEVKFVGTVAALGPGFWVGIQLDEATGDCDGSVLGQPVFQCAPMFGQFLRPLDIEVGDFPPEDTFNMEEDML